MTFQKTDLSKNIIADIKISSISPETNFFSSPSKEMDKKDKLKGLYLDLDDTITAYKTKKKELPSRNE